MWPANKDILVWLVPSLVLPLTLFSGNIFVKYTLGNRDFHFLGGDMALCGFTIFAGNFLRQIHSRTLDEATLSLGIYGCIAMVLAWYGCLWLGAPKIPWRSMVALFIGTFCFSLCTTFAWYIVWLEMPL